MRKHKTAAQDEIFLKFFQAHPDMVCGVGKGGFGNQEQNWIQLKNDLNAAGPPTKDLGAWKKTWVDWRRGIMRKFAVHNADSDNRYIITNIEKGLAILCGFTKTVDESENVNSYDTSEAKAENFDIESSLSSDSCSPLPILTNKGKHRSPKQDKIFLNMFQKHPQMTRGFVKGKKRTMEKLWIQLTNELNDAGPPFRDVSTWKKAWLDWKRNIRRKIDKSKCDELQTTVYGGNGEQYILSYMEEQIAVICGIYKTIEGKSFGTEDNNEESDAESSSSSICSTPSMADLKGKHKNPAQDKIFLKFFRVHPDLSGAYVKGNKKARDEYWAQLANELNAAGPPTKDVSGWKKSWTDWKGNIKKKLALNISEIEKTTMNEGNDNKQILTHTEEKIAVVCDLYETVGVSDSARKYVTSTAISENSNSDDSILSETSSTGSPERTTKETLFDGFNSTMENCLLCLELIDKTVGGIEVNSSKWHDCQIEKLIEKHLWPMQTIKNTSKWLCKTCWQELKNFNKFYVRLEDAQMHFDSMQQIENLNESTFVTEMQETVSLKSLVEENVIIKNEPNVDLWKDDEDDMTLLEISKSLQESLDVEKNIKEDPLQTSTKRKHSKERTKFKTKKLDSTIKPTENPNAKQSPIKQEIGLSEINKELMKAESKDDFNKKARDKTHNADTKKDKFIRKNYNLNCILCQIPMDNFQALLMHFRTVHEEPGYVICCNKKFFRRYILLDHLHQHLNPNYLRCKICNKVFGYRRILKIHGKIHDPKLRNRFCCDVCGLSFHTSVVLNNHKTTHLTEEEKLFPCLDCGKNFGSKWTLDNHNRKVHTSKMNCDICGQLLANNAVLKRHKILKHSANDRNEYKCPICSKLLTNQYGLNNHIRYAHKMGYNHKCTMCDRAFKRKRTLTEHIATHSDTRLYSCPWCPKTSNSHSNIATHRKKFHPIEEENRKQNSSNNTLNLLNTVNE